MATTTYIDGKKQPKVYRGTLYQDDVNDPIFTPEDVTIDFNVVWTRLAAGSFNGTAVGKFAAGKYYMNMRYIDSTITYGYASDDAVYIQHGNNEDGFLTNIPIEILFYD